jgi:hypothetical protein
MDELILQGFKQMLPDGGVRILLKGNRAYTALPGGTFLSDFDSDNITVVDTKSSKYATVDGSAYKRWITETEAAVAKQIPPEWVQSMKVSIDGRKTGRKGIIHGIRAVESEITMKMNLAGPMRLRLVVSFWAPDASEVDRNPGLRELLRFSRRAYPERTRQVGSSNYSHSLELAISILDSRRNSGNTQRYYRCDAPATLQIPRQLRHNCRRKPTCRILLRTP